jgi:hypothetical protein
MRTQRKLANPAKSHETSKPSNYNSLGKRGKGTRPVESAVTCALRREHSGLQSRAEG